MDAFLDKIIRDFLGLYGVVGVIGLIVFLTLLQNSRKLFNWIEDITYEKRDVILKRLEILLVEIPAEKVTLILLAFALVPGTLLFSIFAIQGMIIFGIFLGLAFGFIGWKLPLPIINLMIDKRIEAYQDQMVDGLNLLANGIRAGLSLPQSLAMVVDELKAPISEEFNLVLQQNKIGVPLDECFESLNQRMPTEDNQMFVTSISVLRETGGNLAETFDTIVGVVRERVRLNQKIQTFVAQGKMQGGTIMSMPYLLFLYQYSQDPDTMNLMFTTPVGIAMLIIALGFNLTGGFIILKLIKIKV